MDLVCAGNLVLNRNNVNLDRVSEGLKKQNEELKEQIYCWF
jgi:hypothetical protein